MSKKLFGQIVVLILITGLVHFGVTQFSHWQAQRQYDAALEKIDKSAARPAIDYQAIADRAEAETDAAIENAATWYEADGFNQPDTPAEGEPGE